MDYPLAHPELLSASLEDLIDPALLIALHLPADARKEAIRKLARHEFEAAYSLQLLRPEACAKLLEEVQLFREATRNAGRQSPGLLLGSRWYPEHIAPAYKGLFDRLLAEVYAPVDAALYESSHPLAYHHDYCISFEDTGDKGCCAHTDDSDVTINIYLGTTTEKHEGAELLILAPTAEDTRCGTPRLGPGEYAGTSYLYHHTDVGRAVIWDGEVWHLVQPIRKGCRWNLLTWAMRNDAQWKESFYPEMHQYLKAKAERGCQGCQAA